MSGDRHTSWLVEPLAKRRWRWCVERGTWIAEGEATTEGLAYMAADSALDEILSLEQKESR